MALTSNNLSVSLQSEPSLAAASAAASASLPTAFAGLSDELESVLETSDVLYVNPTEASAEHALLHGLWDEVWAAQQLAGAGEAYAVCMAGADGQDEDAAADAAAHDLVTALRQRDKSTEWRSHAAHRRAERDTAVAARRRAAPSSTIGRCQVVCLLPEDLAEASIRPSSRSVGEELALRAHPDVAGGSGERFQELRTAYQVLLRAAQN